MQITKKRILKIIQTLPAQFDVETLIESIQNERNKLTDWNKDPLTKALGCVPTKENRLSERVDRVVYGVKRRKKHG